ncbi:MAG: hypothetical protein HYW48_02190 [Deltaproteobacteria bacterium]|nr:hypothetical protein [Deltaproteobacteria bacterium]
MEEPAAQFPPNHLLAATSFRVIICTHKFFLAALQNAAVPGKCLVNQPLVSSKLCRGD